MKRIAKSLTLIIAMAMVLAVMPITAFAEGSLYVDSSYLELKPGETGYITVTADQATGRVDWSGSGSIQASGSAWLDNGQATIEVTAVGPGSGSVTVTPVDVATYDGEAIDYNYTVEVNVVDENGAAPAEAEETTTAAEETTTAVEETTTAAEETKVLTDGNNDYENLSEEERMYTTVDGQQHYIIRYPRLLDDNGNVVWNQEITGLDVLTGFELKTVNYKNVALDVFQYQDNLQVFVLKNLETDVCGYYTLGENGFVKLNYVTANGKQYIVIDLESSFQVPQGYQLVDLTLGSNTVKALKKTSNELKGYEATVNPGLDTVDPTDDIYYIYCLVDGEKQLYSYDSGEGTLQRAAAVVYTEVPTEPETVVVYQDAPVADTKNEEIGESTGVGILDMLCARAGFANLTKTTKFIALAAALLLVILFILFIILLICLGAAKSKNKKLVKKLKAGNRGPKSKPRKPSQPSKKKAPKRDEEDDEFFSYVKTEEKADEEDDEFDLQDLK